SQEYVKNRIDKILSIKGSKTVDEFHRQLGKIMWDYVGMSRNREGLQKAMTLIHNLREEFWVNLKLPGEADYKNTELEKAGRVADFLELGELIALDALEREESCGSHFREEYQTPDNEALRNDEKFSHVAAWEFKQGDRLSWERHQEELKFEYVKLTTRNYK
ncbi:MAG: fumarate reductase/succinate dehydrogenase flavoprotein subunit, partial [Bdellovibrio sp.]